MFFQSNICGNFFKAFLIIFVADLIFEEVHSYPKEFFYPDEFEDINEEGEYLGHHHHHHHHDHFNDPKPEDISRTLILSHVIFRHGNRTPDSFQELYPNDPYLNNTYYPIGLGQLTNAGKVREYSIGTSLRKRYSSFLNEMFLPEEVEATSTDYNRTKASLELALAGLFPPRSEQIWNKELMWQPAPYNYAPRSQDRPLMGVTCPNYLKIYEKVQEKQRKTQFRKYHQEFNYVSRHSGINVKSVQDIYNLYFGLSTEEEYGLILPKWTQIVWPQKIVAMAIEEYYVMMATDDLKKMASGYLLKKMLEDTVTKISENGSKKKIFLYSAHENNVAQFLILLDVFRPHIPNYGAHVIVEVHKIQGIFGVKVFYQNNETEEPELLKIPKCGEFCRLEEFIELFRKYIPEDSLCGN